MREEDLQTILYDIENKVAKVTFNRPDVHNAFNDIMIKELSEVFDCIAENNDVRVVSQLVVALGLLQYAILLLLQTKQSSVLAK
jgi:1,4-dihydroxy-2-naphthoyl-CoA synthase